FCAFCNRIRLTADGKLRLCLLRNDEVDVRDILRSGGTEEDLIEQIRFGGWRKPWGHGLAEGDRNTGRGMSQSGGRRGDEACVSRDAACAGSAAGCAARGAGGV